MEEIESSSNSIFWFQARTVVFSTAVTRNSSESHDVTPAGRSNWTRISWGLRAELGSGGATVAERIDALVIPSETRMPPPFHPSPYESRSFMV